MDKQDQDLMALLICGVGATESTKVSFAPWNFFADMCTSENQHRPTSNGWTVMLRAININEVAIDVARTSALFIRRQTRSWS